MRRTHPNVRRDAIRVALRNRQWRIALVIALIPAGWSISDETHRQTR